MSTATAEPTPAQTVAKTVAEVAPKLAVAAKAIALDDMQRQLRDHAARVSDSHRMGAKALGMEELVEEPEKGSMGHIVITGDINVSDPASLQSAMSALSGQPQPQQTPPPSATPEVPRANIAPVAGGAGSLWKTALISAALIALPGIGVAIPWLAGAFDRPESAVVVDTDTDTQTSWATGE